MTDTNDQPTSPGVEPGTEAPTAQSESVDPAEGNVGPLIEQGEPQPHREDLPGETDFPTGHESATMSGEHSPALDERGVAQSGLIDPEDAGVVENEARNATDFEGALQDKVRDQMAADAEVLRARGDGERAVELDDVLNPPEPEEIAEEPLPERHAPGPTLPANFDHAVKAALNAEAGGFTSPADDRHARMLAEQEEAQRQASEEPADEDDEDDVDPGQDETEVVGNDA